MSPKKNDKSKTLSKVNKESVKIMNIEKPLEKPDIKIKVFGIGGGGCSIVGEIVKIIPPGRKISFCAANTDIQSLAALPDSIKHMILGKELTQGLGCGMNPEIGRQAAELSQEAIKKEIASADFCVFISGLGGGTGSGAMPIFAEIAKQMKKISLGIFTMPFGFEGEKRKKIAHDSLEKIRPNLSASLIIPNDKIFNIIDTKTAIKQSFSIINKNLAETINGLLETLFLPGLINIDFADFKTILDGYGKNAYQNSVEGERKDVGQLLEKLLDNPLADNAIISNKPSKIISVDRILFNISGPNDLKMSETEDIAKKISSANIKAKIIFGINLKGDKCGKIKITILAIGDDAPFFKKPEPIFKLNADPKIEDKKIIPATKNPAVKSEPEKKLIKKKKEKAKKSTKSVVKKLSKTDTTSLSKNQRKNALDIKKDQEIVEKKQSEQEKKWDIPAFLRIKK